MSLSLNWEMTGESPINPETDAEGGCARCAFCKFWCPTDPHHEHAECHRHAPSPKGFKYEATYEIEEKGFWACWPTTYEGHICGEFIWAHPRVLSDRSREAGE